MGRRPSVQQHSPSKVQRILRGTSSCAGGSDDSVRESTDEYQQKPEPVSTTRESLSDGEFKPDLPEAKQALTASNKDQFRLVVEAIQDHAIFMLGTGGHVISWNLGAERLKGYRAAEIIGHHFSCFYPEEDQRKPARLLKLAATEGSTKDEGWCVEVLGKRDHRGDQEPRRSPGGTCEADPGCHRTNASGKVSSRK